MPKLGIICLLLLSLSGRAQLKLPITNDDLRTNLSRVISDYFIGFANLKADTIKENPQSIEFATSLKFLQCEVNTITQYKSTKPAYSWEAIMLTSENFEEASKKYKWLINQLKMMTVKTPDHSFSLSGDYNPPDENKKFCGSIFKLTPGTIDMPKLRVEAVMRLEFPEWKLCLLVYEREREDNERGEINGN